MREALKRKLSDALAAYQQDNRLRLDPNPRGRTNEWPTAR
jgi:hypothetical protein